MSGRQHIPRHSTGLSLLRIAQLLLAFPIIALCAYAVHTVNLDHETDKFDPAGSLMLATACLTVIGSLALILTASRRQQVTASGVPLLVDTVLFVLWLSSFILLATKLPELFDSRSFCQRSISHGPREHEYSRQLSDFCEGDALCIKNFAEYRKHCNDDTRCLRDFRMFSEYCAQHPTGAKYSAYLFRDFAEALDDFDEYLDGFKKHSHNKERVHDFEKTLERFEDLVDDYKDEKLPAFEKQFEKNILPMIDIIHDHGTLPKNDIIDDQSTLPRIDNTDNKSTLPLIDIPDDESTHDWVSTFVHLLNNSGHTSSPNHVKRTTHHCHDCCPSDFDFSFAPSMAAATALGGIETVLSLAALAIGIMAFHHAKGEPSSASHI